MLWTVVQVSLVVCFFVSSFALVALLQYFARRSIDDEEKRPPKRHVVRGHDLVSLEQAKVDLERNAPTTSVEPRTLYVSGTWLPRTEETNNKGVFGAIGSGKTGAADYDMLNAFKRIHAPLSGEIVGGIVVDTKKESIPKLASIVGLENIINLNPFDARSVAPDLAGMYKTEANVHGLSSTMVQKKENDTQPFWVQSCQDNVSSVTMVFNERATGRWDARDILEACASVPRLAFVLKQSPQTWQLVETYLSNETLSRNILASLRANLRDWRPVAAIWSRTPNKIHLGRFVEELGKVLVLQPDIVKELASRAVQRLMLQRLFEYGLMLPSSKQRRIFLFGDEIQELGRLDRFDSILSTGRSRGWSVFLYTQTIDGMLLHYGEHMTEKMLDNISSWTFFAANGRTAEWIARKFGKLEMRRMIEVLDPSDESNPKSKSPQYQIIDAVLPVEVSRILPPTAERGATSLNITRLTRPFYSTVKGLDRQLPRPMPGVEPFVPRPSSDEILKPWALEDLRRLNLEVGPDDDLEALLGPQPDLPDAPQAPSTAAIEKTVTEPVQGLFGKLLGRGLFVKGDDR